MPSRKGVLGSQSEDLLDEGVIAVAASNTLRGIRSMVALQFDTSNIFDHADQIIDRDQFTGTQVDGCSDQVIAVHDHVDAFDAVVDVHETAGLVAVAPNVDFQIRRYPWASITLRLRAAGAFSRPPSQVPLGP